MLSKVTRYCMFKLIREAHRTFQCPLVWDANEEKFLLDTSTKYKFFSWIVTLVDCFGVILILLLIS